MAQPRNIIIIITHDTGRQPGCYGSGATTPHLDRMADEGIRFTNLFCAAPQCSPSRASLLTGLMPVRHGLIGLTHRGFQLRSGVPTLPVLLADAGYQTHLFGFQHESKDPHALGYQHVHRGQNHACRNVAPLVTEFLRSQPQSPFFAMVGFSETHRVFPTAPEPAPAQAVPSFLPGVPEIRQDIADLNLSLTHADEAIGAIRQTLAESGLADHTLMLYTTDHGIAFPGAKATLFDPGVGISLIAQGPAPFNGGRAIDALASNVDIMPTLLDWAGVAIPGDIDGISLLPAITGAAQSVREHVWIEQTYHAAYDPMRGVRTTRYKYIRSFEPGPWWVAPNVDDGLSKRWFREHRPELFAKERPAELLFDLAKDPLEQTNLAGHPEHAALLAQLRTLVETRMQAVNDPLLKGQVPLPEEAITTPRTAWNPNERTGRTL